MKKILFLLVVIPMVLLSACSKEDEEENVKLTTEQVVGKWNVTWAQEDGESIDIPVGNVYMNLKGDGTYRTVMFGDYYIGEWKLEGNTVVGTTTDPITERYTFTSLNGKNAEIDYSNSVGDKMRFRAEKDNEDLTTYSLNIHVEQLKSFDITDNPTRLHSRFEIYEGSGLEKKDPNEVDYAYDKSGKKVKAIASSDREFSFHFEYKIGEEYFVFVKVMDSNSFCNGAYSYCTFSPKNGETYELTKIFSYNTSEGEYEDWNVDLSKETPKDFYVGKWGDSKEKIKSKETHNLVENTSTKLKYYLSINKYLSYMFDNSGLYKGEVEYSNTAKMMNGGAVLLGYLTELDNLKKKYGEPTSFTKDVYSSEASSDEFRIMGENVAKGGSITYTFNDGKVIARIIGDREYYMYMGGGIKWTITQTFNK